MASSHLINAYLGTLARQLPADTVDELADGLIETWHQRMATGLDPDRAARAAITEFGRTDQVVDEFVAQAPGRRIARLLLATGPLVGLCWGTSLIAARVWTWPVPHALLAVYAAAVVVTVAALIFAATTRRSFRRTRLGVAGGLALVLLDATMIAGVAALAPAFAWPLAIAVVASLGRIGLSLTSAPSIRTL